MALEVASVSVGYSLITLPHSVSFRAEAGQVTCIMGLVPATTGTVTFNGTAAHTLPAHEVPKRGSACVPQGRRLFGPLTVAENLAIGGLARGNYADALD